MLTITWSLRSLFLKWVLSSMVFWNTRTRPILLHTLQSPLVSPYTRRRRPAHSGHWRKLCISIIWAEIAYWKGDIIAGEDSKLGYNFPVSCFIATCERGSWDLNAGLGVGEGGGPWALKKIYYSNEKLVNWLSICSQLLFSYSNVLYTVYRHISDS